MPLDPDEILLEAEASMEKATEFTLHEFGTIRTGKATPSLVDSLDVEVYGSSMKLKQVALISTPEPRLIVIQPFDASTTQAIEKAIRESRIGITPSVDGRLIRLPIPALSEERRKEMAKTVVKIAEEGRVRIRASRREAMDSLKKAQKDGAITEDALESYEKDVQKLTDTFIKKIDDSATAKEAELMKI